MTWNTVWRTVKASKYRGKKERSVALKIRQMRLQWGLYPRPCWGAQDAVLDHLVGWSGDNPPHAPLHSASILLLSALVTWRFYWGGGHFLQIFFSRTARCRHWSYFPIASAVYTRVCLLFAFTWHRNSEDRWSNWSAVKFDNRINNNIWSVL